MKFKKIFITAVCLLLSVTLFCGCSDFGSYSNSTKKKKVVHFAYKDIIISLNEDFKKGEEKAEGYNAFFESDNVGVLISRKLFTDFDSDGVNMANVSLRQYAEKTIEYSGLSDVTSVVTDEKLTYFVYTQSTSNVEFKYFSTVLKNDEAFWLVTIYTYESIYDSLADQIRAWAETIRFKDSEK